MAHVCLAMSLRVHDPSSRVSGGIEGLTSFNNILKCWMSNAEEVF